MNANSHPSPEPTQGQRLFFYRFFVAECPSAPLYIYGAYHKGYLTQAQIETFIQRINQPRRVLPIYGYVLAQLTLTTFNPN